MCYGMNQRQRWSDQTMGITHQKQNLTTELLSKMTISTGDRLPLKASNLWIWIREARIPLRIWQITEWIMCHTLWRNVTFISMRNTSPVRSHLMASLLTKFLTRGCLLSQPSWLNHTSQSLSMIVHFPLQLSFRKNTKLGHFILCSPKKLLNMYLQ